MKPNHMNQSQVPNGYYTDEKKIYPDIYRKVSPYINKEINELGDYRNISDEEIRMLTDKIITESKIMMNPPERHNRETIYDIVKMLLILKLEDWDDDYYNDDAVPALYPLNYYPYPYSYPYGYNYFPFPFFFGGNRYRNDRRGGRYGGGHRDGHDGGHRDGHDGGHGGGYGGDHGGRYGGGSRR